MKEKLIKLARAHKAYAEVSKQVEEEGLSNHFQYWIQLFDVPFEEVKDWTKIDRNDHRDEYSIEIEGVTIMTLIKKDK